MGAIEMTDELVALVDREWGRLRQPGTWFTGAERVAVAAAARSIHDPDTPAQRAARTIHDTPARITRDWLAGLESEGLALVEYVEVLGIVARLRALDTLTFGLGQLARPLPEAVSGEPTRTPVDDAEANGAWVPTVGAAFPPTVLSVVPAENEAMHDVHAVLYLAVSDDGDDGDDGDGYSMANMAVVRDGLGRSQMEFVAARTSLLNDCFF